MKALTMETNDYRMLADALRRVDFFRDLSVSDLDDVFRHVRLYGFEAGENVFRQGDPGDALFVVLEGSFAARKRAFVMWPAKDVGALEPGAVFGEMALLERRPRSATVVARTSGKLFALLSCDFDDLMVNNSSFARHIRKIASHRTFENARAA